MTAPNTEMSVCRRLYNAHHQHALFTRKSLIVRRGRKIERLVAAWPRYVFVWCVDTWHAILEISGVVDFLRDENSAPVRLPENFVEQTRIDAGADQNLILPTQLRQSRFQFGQRVMVCGNGVAAGYEAVFQYPLENGKVHVLQQWLGSPRSIQVDELELMPMNEFRRATRKRKWRKRKRHVGQSFRHEATRDTIASSL
jgi:hypothetical protein